ncbi:MAG: SURF1 family protein [Stenotrophobium sp.]
MTETQLRRSLFKIAGWGVVAAVLFAGFFALGSWQVARRAWKLDLIARVDQRVHAPPVVTPGRKDWPRINAVDDAYRHVRATGEFLGEDETLVYASTQLGDGYWLMTPLRMANGDIILVNRGFISSDFSASPAFKALPRPRGQVVITGLLRLSEPHGGFLRRNQPTAKRWYSRDVAAIAAADKLPAQVVAPYFIDADALPQSGNGPVGGLTVISFYNHHLSYAITWYALAAMTLLGAAILIRYEWQRRSDA